MAEQKKADESFGRGDYVEGAGHWLAGKLPFIGPAAAAIGEQIGGTNPEFDQYGNVTKSGTQPDLVGGISRGVATVAAPQVYRGVGAAIKTAALPMVKSALNIPGKTEAYGATPAQAVLDETSGITPAAVENSARQRIGQLTGELESRAANATKPVSLAPARQVVARKIARSMAANSAATPSELAPLNSFLNEPQPGFTGATEYPQGANTPITITPAPPSHGALTPNPTPSGPPTVTAGAAPSQVISEEQSPLQALAMRRQLNEDFIRNWNPTTNTKGGLGTARQTYHALGNEIDKAIPGGSQLDQRISSLIPVAERSRITDLAPTLTERIMNRVARPTGGLLGAAFGSHYYGPGGALAGLLLPEVLSNPVVKTAAARGLYGAGRGMAGPTGLLTLRPGRLVPFMRPGPDAGRPAE